MGILRYLPVVFRPILIGFTLLAFALAAGCGPSAPLHNGYRKKHTKPWLKAKIHSFDEAGEIEIDSKVSWAKRRRARWYAIDVPVFGDLSVTLRSEQIGESSDEFDLAFEVLAENGKILLVADKEEDDAGEEEKERALAEVDPGRYLIHVFLQSRLSAATFNLRVKFVPGVQPDDSTFPREVAYIGNLPAVPPVDDAPPPVVKRKCKKGKRCKRVVTRAPPPSAGKSVRVRITGITASERGSRIRIGAGKNKGITKGSRGAVISKGGSRITNGGFTVSRVTATESFASVRAKSDAVNGAKYVRIKLTPPPAE